MFYDFGAALHPPLSSSSKRKQNKTKRPHDYSVVFDVSKPSDGSFLLFERKVGYTYETDMREDISVNNNRDTGYLLPQLTGYVVFKEPLVVSNEHEESSSRISVV